MPKNSWNDYSTTASANTDVHSVSIAEGMAPSDVNNALREILVDTANFDQGNVTLTSALAVASGGTGAATHTANNVLVGAGTGAVTSVAPSTSGNVLTSNGTVWQSTAAAAGAPGNNILINGSCAIAQRGALSAQGGTNVYTSVDRWELADPAGGQARWNLAQGTSGGVSGKDLWLSATVSTAESAVAASELNALRQKVEGNNAAGIINSSGQIAASTLSFDVKFDAHASSSTSAPYAACVFIYAVDANYTFTSEFSIAADNTWERISVSVPALAQAASNVDTSEGYRVGFMLYAGSTYHATSGSWESGSNALATSNQENLADYAGNVFGVTNIQWNAGSGTDFEYEAVGTTRQKCLRYYETTPKTTAYNVIGHGLTWDSGQAYGYVFFYPKRAAPTVTSNGNCPRGVVYAGTVGTTTSFAQSTTENIQIWYQGSSGLSAGAACVSRANNSTGDFLEFSAEL